MKFLLSIVVLSFPLTMIFGQIHVHEEKLHTLVLENNYLNVIEILAKPGDAAEMHTHKHNYAYLALKGGKMLLQDKGEDEREVNLPDLYAGGKYNTLTNPFSHRFVNLDDHDIHFLAVEHKASYQINKDLKLDFHPDDVLIDNQFFLVVKIKMQPLASVSKEVPYPGVIICPDQEEVLSFKEDKHSKMPLWSYQEAGTKLMLSNQEKEEEVLYLYMVK